MRQVAVPGAPLRQSLWAPGIGDRAYRSRPRVRKSAYHRPMERWKPSVTVAAVVAHHGRYLLVEERTAAGLRLNNPAGHLDPGESLLEAVVREALEETARVFVP